jgi:hypothetical protein
MRNETGIFRTLCLLRPQLTEQVGCRVVTNLLRRVAGFGIQ